MVKTIAITVSVLLIVFALLSTSAVAKKRDECSRCQKNVQCKTNLCRFNKCIYSYPSSFFKCFPERKKKECSPCKRNFECNTGRCNNNKCVYWTARSVRKCSGSKKGECADCSFNRECKSNVCLDKKCVSEGSKTNQGCFLKPECTPCKFNKQCSQGFCIRSKCTDGSVASRKRCGLIQPPKGKKDCDSCSFSYECKSRKCYKGKCGPVWKVRRCPREECAKCNFGWECEVGNCYRNKCSDGSPESLKKCLILIEYPPKSPPKVSIIPGGDKPACEACKYDFECKAGVCTKGRCGNPSRLRFCPREECEACRRSFQCLGSFICIKNKCSDGSDESLIKCGLLPGDVTTSPSPSSIVSVTPSVSPSVDTLKKDCEPCDFNSECAAGYCWRRGGVCGRLPGARFCPREDCDFCRFNNQCKSGFCIDSTCTDGKPETLISCGIVPNVTATPTTSVTSSALASSMPSNMVMPGNKTACSTCTTDSECISLICTNGKCGTPRRVGFCPREECQFCERTLQCVSGLRCMENLCSDGSRESLIRCRLAPNVTVTASPSSTSSTSPSVSASASSSPKVLKMDCQNCTSFTECVSGSCVQGLCGAVETIQFCPRDNCDFCRFGRQCKSGRCAQNLCTDGTAAGLAACRTISPTPSSSSAATMSSSVSASASMTSGATVSPSSSVSPSSMATMTATSSPSSTAMATVTATASTSVTASVTATASASMSVTATATTTASPTPSSSV